MKKMFVLCLSVFFFSFASQAQTTVPEKKKTEIETKIKPKKTIKDRVHNTLHPKRKHYSGVKVKTEVKKES